MPIGLNTKMFLFIIGLGLFFFFMLLIVVLLLQKQSQPVVVVVNGQQGADNFSSQVAMRNNGPLSINKPISNCSAFFEKSVLFAESFLKGQSNLNADSLNSASKRVILAINTLNNEYKKNIILSMHYLCINPNTSDGGEAQMRNMSETEQIPLWIIVLREVGQRVVPSFKVERELVFNPLEISGNSPSNTNNTRITTKNYTLAYGRN